MKMSRCAANTAGTTCNDAMIVSHPPRSAQLSLLDHALAYRHRGWSIIPVAGKRALGKWKHLQQRRPTVDELRAMFSRSGVTGLAVILGQVSGGLCVRDFDDVASYKKWKAQFPKTAKRLPTVRTARGYHVYCRIDDETFHDFGDGELRGDSGHYVLLPPSVHPDGVDYRWIVDLPDGKLPVVRIHKLGIVTQRTQNTQAMVCVESIHKNKAALCSLCNIPVSVDRDDVQQAIKNSQPRRPGRRNRKVFQLCRELKAIADLADLPAAAFHAVVKEWHRQALSTIATKHFSETWENFTYAWPRVKHPAGQGVVQAAFARASKRKPPKLAVKMYGPDDPAVKLAALCRELQRGRADGEFFYLDCRTAAKLLKVSTMTAWRWLNMLCRDGLLVEGEKGNRESRKANEYCWVGSVS